MNKIILVLSGFLLVSCAGTQGGSTLPSEIQYCVQQDFCFDGTYDGDSVTSFKIINAVDSTPIRTMKIIKSGKRKDVKHFEKQDSITSAEAKSNSKQDSLSKSTSGSGQSTDSIKGPGKRSVKEIMTVVKEETPKLKTIYNDYLRNYSFKAKVFVEMLITAQGKIMYLYPKKIETTDVLPEGFIENIALEISLWQFEDIEKGNTTVTIPFTFNDD